MEHLIIVEDKVIGNITYTQLTLKLEDANETVQVTGQRLKTIRAIRDIQADLLEYFREGSSITLFDLAEKACEVCTSFITPGEMF